MKAAEHSVDLVVPGLLGPVPESVAQSPGAAIGRPALERFLSRGRRFADHQFDPVGLLADRFDTQGRPVAAGPVGLRGVGGEPGGGFWYRVDAVHLRPDRDRLLVFGPAAVGVTAGECEAVAEACNRLLAEDDLRLVPARDHWYLAVGTVPDVAMHSIYRVSGHYMDDHLPSGADARRWNALLTELQMLLHGLGLNAEREARGLPTLNGLWPWGGGVVPGRCVNRYDHLYADHPVAKGLAELAGGEAAALPDGWPADTRGGQVGVFDTRPLDALTSGDAQAWLDAVDRFEAGWLAPLLQALERGGLDRLRLFTGCGRRWTGDRWALRRFWRRRGGFRHWLEGAAGPGEGDQ